MFEVAGVVSFRRRYLGMKYTEVAALLLMFSLAVLVVGCVSRSDVPPLERRAQGLNQELMCPVCPGESIDQSQNKLASQMRTVVSERIEQGWTDGQIKDFFVERYGPSVLLAPPRRGFNLTVWVLPPVGVAGALVALYLVLRTMRRTRSLGPDGGADAVSLSEDEKARYFGLIGSVLRESEPGSGDAEDEDQM